MVQFHPFRDVAKESIRGGSRNFLLGGGERERSQNFDSEKTVEVFLWKITQGGGLEWGRKFSDFGGKWESYMRY